MTLPRITLALLLVLSSVTPSGCRDAGPTANGPSVTLTTPRATIPIGGTLQLVVTVRNASGDVVSVAIVSWSTSDASIVSVNQTGQVTAHAIGMAKISASAAEGTATLDLTVVPPEVASLQLDPWKASLAVGESITFVLYATDTQEQPVTDLPTWKSSNPTIATVDGGRVQALAEGTTTITATVRGVFTTADVTVFASVGRFSLIEPGNGTTCGLNLNGRPFCWGLGAGVGDGTLIQTDVPKAVSGDLRFDTLVVGYEVGGCGLNSNGRYCWGSGEEGRLGRGFSEGIIATPQLFADPIKYVQMTLGRYHGCGLAADGRAYCWGRARLVGDSQPAPTGFRQPTRVASGTVRFSQISAGYDYTCALSTLREIWCWGVGGSGQLGNGGSPLTTNYPVLANAAVRFTSVSAGWAHACALGEDLRAYCWGAYAQGANGSTASLYSPTPVPGNLEFSSVSAFYASCGRRLDNTAWCWGYDPRYVVSRVNEYTPAALNGGVTFRTLRAGWGSAGCGVGQDGIAYCWGQNSVGEVGDGTKTNRFTPTRVAQQP